MNVRYDAILALAALQVDASAVGHAALEGDLEEARFRAHLLNVTASEIGMEHITAVTRTLMECLGHRDEQPMPGIGAALLRLVNAIEDAFDAT